MGESQRRNAAVRTRQTGLTVANDLPPVVKGLNKTTDPSRRGQHVRLDLSRPVGEQDAQELKGEEAEVEVVRGEEVEEAVEGGCSREEDVRVAKTRVIADGLDDGERENQSAQPAGGVRHVPWRDAHPAINLLDLAEKTEGLDDGLCDLDVFGSILLEHAQQDRERAGAHVLLTRPGQRRTLRGGGARASTDRFPVPAESLEAEESSSAVFELGPVQQPVAQLVNRLRRALGLPCVAPQRSVPSRKAGKHLAVGPEKDRRREEGKRGVR